VAVYVNDSHVPGDGGKVWKHLDANCSLLAERAKAGYAIKRVRNIDHGRAPGSSLRRRCPICFQDGPAIEDAPSLAWLEQARRRQQADPSAVAWTYDLMWPARMASQVGMATDLHGRLASRWRGTCKGRLVGADSIPWLYDAIRAGCADQIALKVEAFPSRESALEAERRLRERKRREGWQVSSDR
jgi:hypothetical protein